jgi:cytochrome c-type biogenesis protein CcmH
MSRSIDTLREKLRQLQTLHENGTLGADAYALARAPLERELVELVLRDAEAASPRVPRRLQIALAAAVLVVAAVGYSITGSPDHWTLGPAPGAGSVPVATDAAPDEPQVTDEQINEVIDRMAQRLKEAPDDAMGWTLLARAYSATGRFAEAVPAFEKAVALVPDDAGLMADYADALAAQNNGKFGPQALGLIDRALALDPQHLKALALSGSAAYDRRDYATAVQQWEKVARGLPADSPMRPQVLASITQAREAGGLPAAPPPPAAAPRPAAPAPAGVATTAGVSGRVSVAPALSAQVSPQDTVFILARPVDGPRMPLAVLRKQVKDLPTGFTLDDSMAMAPGATISSHAKVIITARVSKSGDAMPQPGDLIGVSAPVAPGADGVAIEITDVVSR